MRCSPERSPALGKGGLRDGEHHPGRLAIWRRIVIILPFASAAGPTKFLRERFSVASTEPSSSLADRVQSLRLPPQGSGSSGSATLPWLLTFVLAGAVAYLLLIGNPFQPKPLEP